MGTRSPTTKRIMKEASELASQPSPDFHAAPLETDLFEWHFTIRGPPAPSPFEGGVYHGRIVLPPAYPLKPPSFRFLTASGRFEVNREICLSISGHHEESWQPAWGIRTALVAIRSFMDTDAKGQLGGMDASDEVRRRFAAQSMSSRCATCGKSNADIVKEMNEAAKEVGETKPEEVPEQLRLAYREDLSKAEGKMPEGQSKASPQPPAPVMQNNPALTPTPTTAQARPAPVPPAAPTIVPQQQQRQPVRQDDGVPAWIDKSIYSVAFALLIFVWSKWFV
ncbi:related to ubiquitin-conjugating enzyme E2 6 [Ramularia collo-cygni]|uniref:Related to ubiquitin-conjugating enzyme E2 6 n=1 Tax=Ramularia collo-cygni TaxID=112498 RepID=A0A2D3V2N5_9PEZI|nr:related to ubiquitin-conjugating enzyme E2 6 [Ramularia collo-cygni]CZT19730.1 related to ubiquitin-conjugating enzyme E2 6 [Ramularia collo-cygni]